MHANFKPLDETLVADYVKSQPGLIKILGGSSKDWIVKEVGDGNLNFVYILTGPKGSFVLKQVRISRKEIVHFNDCPSQFDVLEISLFLVYS